MPHIVVEYTANIRDDARIPTLLRTINATLIAQGGVFPTGGIRSRAIELQDYCVADGTGDDAFVHVTLKIGSGRSDETKKAACDALFDATEYVTTPLPLPVAPAVIVSHDVALLVAVHVQPAGVVTLSIDC